MNELKLGAVECQHPFGDGIHVLIPESEEITFFLLKGLRIVDLLHQDYVNLKKLVTTTQAAFMVVVYKGEAPAGAPKDCYGIISVLINPDLEVEYSSIFLLVESGYETLAAKVAE